LITSKIQGEDDASGEMHPGDMALRGAPSVLFDAVVVLAGDAGDAQLAQNPNAVSFLVDAYRHGKAMAWKGIPALFAKAQLQLGDGMVVFDGNAKKSTDDFIADARKTRFFERENETPGVLV
jgi:catalase